MGLDGAFSGWCHSSTCLFYKQRKTWQMQEGRPRFAPAVNVSASSSPWDLSLCNYYRDYPCCLRITGSFLTFGSLSAALHVSQFCCREVKCAKTSLRHTPTCLLWGTFALSVCIFPLSVMRWAWRQIALIQHSWLTVATVLSNQVHTFALKWLRTVSQVNIDAQKQSWINHHLRLQMRWYFDESSINFCIVSVQLTGKFGSFQTCFQTYEAM